jgi:hypothetical protein
VYSPVTKPLRSSDENDSSLCREALSFLRTNTALKTLYLHFEPNATESHATAIRMEVLAALRENKSPETFSMTSKLATFDDYLSSALLRSSQTYFSGIQGNCYDMSSAAQREIDGTRIQEVE